MKQEWRTVRLGDLLKIQNGFAFSSKQFSTTEGMPLVRIRSLKSGTEDETFYSGPFDEQYLVNAGDLLIGMDGEFGCHEWKGPTALLNQRVCRLQDFNEELLPRFLYYGINSHLKAIESATGFTTVKHLSSSTVLNIEFPVPTLDEQQRIVRLLDEAFGGIAVAKANAEKNLRNARALFESRLQSVFTQSGAGWTVRKLGEVCAYDRTQGKHLGLPYVGLEHIESHTARFTGLTAPAQVKSSTFRFTKEHVLYGRLRPYLNKVLVLDFEGHCSTEIFPLKPAPGLLRNFLKYWLLSGTTCELIDASSTGTRMPRANMNAVLDLSLAVPSVSEQQRIITELEALEASTSALSAVYTKKRAALNSLEESLLHQAFSGSMEAA